MSTKNGSQERMNQKKLSHQIFDGVHSFDRGTKCSSFTFDYIFTTFFFLFLTCLCDKFWANTRFTEKSSLSSTSEQTSREKKRRKTFSASFTNSSSRRISWRWTLDEWRSVSKVIREVKLSYSKIKNEVYWIDLRDFLCSIFCCKSSKLLW